MSPIDDPGCVDCAFFRCLASLRFLFISLFSSSDIVARLAFCNSALRVLACASRLVVFDKSLNGVLGLLSSDIAAHQPIIKIYQKRPLIK
jgi:hypothetical protein